MTKALDDVFGVCPSELGQASLRVVVGLSGGRDSVALLHLLHRAGCVLFARHLHHGLRGAAADADAQFCQELCERLGINYACEKLKVVEIARQRGASFESVARELRREYLKAEAQQANAPYIALGHHADDQAETLLFRLGRGSLRAMRARVSEGALHWVRPLLSWRRAEIELYLRAQGLSWRDDATNDELDCTRNEIRHCLLPQMSGIMRRDVTPLIARAARVAEQRQLALEQALEAMELLDPQGRLYLPKVRTLAPELRRAALLWYLRLQNVSELSERLLHEVEAILPAETTRARVNVAGGGQLCRREGRLVYEKN